MNKSINDVVERMKKARTWTEFGMSVKDVLSVLIEYIASKDAPDKEESETIADLHTQLAEKDKTISNLRESNKKLRQENKRLKEGY